MALVRRVLRIDCSSRAHLPLGVAGKRARCFTSGKELFSLLD